MSHSSRASLALRALAEADPALSALALWCNHRDSDTVSIAESDAATIFYGPQFTLLAAHEQLGLAAHHVLHVALRHAQRQALLQARFGDGFDATLYNIAADAIVNEALLLAGYALPRPALTLTGVLEALPGGVEPAAQALERWDADRLYVRLRQGGGQDAGAAQAHAATRGFGPDLRPQDGPEDAQAGADWRGHLVRALEAGRMAGRGIGALGHRIADIPEPRVPWEVILRRLLTRAVTEAPQPSHRRPARTWIAMEALAHQQGGPVPAFQPGHRRANSQPRIAIGLDASSSIDEARLSLFMAEVTGIARRTTAEVHLLPFDEAVQAAVRLDPARWRQQMAALKVPRGGGTSFAPVIAQAMSLAPSVIVVLTDLDGDFGPAPRVPVIWAVPQAEATAPFGTTLSLAR